jgi:hypothetical protein
MIEREQQRQADEPKGEECDQPSLGGRCPRLTAPGGPRDCDKCKFISRFGVALWLMIVGEPPSSTNPQNTPPFNDLNMVFVEVEKDHKYRGEQFRIVKGGKAGPWRVDRSSKKADNANW